MPYLKLLARSVGLCPLGSPTESKFLLIQWSGSKTATHSIKITTVSYIKPINLGFPFSTTSIIPSHQYHTIHKVSRISPILFKILIDHPKATKIGAQEVILLLLWTQLAFSLVNKLKMIPLISNTFAQWPPTTTFLTRDREATLILILSLPQECLLIRVPLGPNFTEILRTTILSRRAQKELTPRPLMVKAMKALK